MQEGRLTSSHLCSILPFLSFSLCCTHWLNGNYLHLRQLSGPNLISYLPLFYLSFVYTLITHTHKWPLKPFFTSFLLFFLSNKLCSCTPIVTVIYCVILNEPTVPPDLQTRQGRVVWKCVQLWQEFVQAWSYISSFKSSSSLFNIFIVGFPIKLLICACVLLKMTATRADDRNMWFHDLARSKRKRERCPLR